MSLVWFLIFQLPVRLQNFFFRGLHIYALEKKDSLDLTLHGNVFVFQSVWYPVCLDFLDEIYNILTLFKCLRAHTSCWQSDFKGESY